MENGAHPSEETEHECHVVYLQCNIEGPMDHIAEAHRTIKGT